MAYALSGRAGVNFSLTESTQRFPLGTEEPGSDGNTYVYVKASQAVAAYQACKLDDDHTIKGVTTTITGTEPTWIVYPQIAFTANYYGWVVAYGRAFSVLAEIGASKDRKVYTSGTSGTVSTTGTSDLIQGLKLTTTNGAAVAATAAFAGDWTVANGQN